MARSRVELDEFEKLVHRYLPTRDFAAELRFWRFDCDAWEEYRSRQDEFDSYLDYLEHGFGSYEDYLEPGGMP
jgi:hypothetical protein